MFVKSQPSSREGIDLFVGEDAGVFDWSNEKMGALGERGWLTFFAAVGAILSALAVLWINPATGYNDDFVAFLEEMTDGNSHLITLIFGIIFPIMHSGLASLRPYGEKVVGARTWRVIFAWPSLCLAYSWITYFIAHAHDGVVLWDGAQVGWLHAVAWMINFASFFFLYPSVFNLKEVAAVEIPQVHLWETGIMRITRHPQFVGQSMWSAAHLMMVSFLPSSCACTHSSTPASFRSLFLSMRIAMVEEVDADKHDKHQLQQHWQPRSWHWCVRLEWQSLWQ